MKTADISGFRVLNQGAFIGPRDGLQRPVATL